MIGHPYPSYRPSGVEWLGDIPAHWEVRRIRHTCEFAYGDSLPAAIRQPGKVPVSGSNGVIGYHDEPNTLAPVIVIGRKGSHGEVNFSDASVFAIDTTYFVDERHTSADLRWLYFALQCTELADESLDSAVPGLSREHAYGKCLPVPPVAEQRAIADYLDTETARIDTLISKKRRLIELLQERWGVWVRNQLASLPNPALPLKRHWRVIDCKHRTPTYVEEGYPVVSPGDATPGRLDLRRAHRFVDESDYNDLASGYRQPKRGDIVYSRNASIGIASNVDTDEPFCMGQDVCLIQSNDMDQLFLMYALNSIGLDQLETQKIGSTFDRVNISQILEIRIPVPDPSEQQKLGRRFDLAASLRSRAQGILEQQIDLLQEYRKALITAAVTGQISLEA